MKAKIIRISILLLVFGLTNLDPDFIGGSSPARRPFVPDNSRIVNSFSALEDYSSIERTVNYFMRIWELKGASIAIARNGKLVYAKGYGQADRKGNIEVQPYHRFRIASISKLVTATAIMKLYDDNELDLNDKVFGPESILDDEYFMNARDSRAYDITIAHLLSHQGGWTTRWGDHMFMPHVVASSLEKDLPVTTKDVVRFALNKRLHFTPGRGRSYSNLGYAILGLVVEKVSGMSYGEYCKIHLFEPLGIYDFELARNLYEQRDILEVAYFEPTNAVPKESIYGTGETVPASDGGNDIESLGGAGAWIATAPDLLKFMLAIDGFESRKDILSDEAIRIMTGKSNRLSPVGWKATTTNGYWWRTGSFAGTSAMLRRQPDGTAWVVIFNTNTWKQSMFPSDISKMMARALSRTRNWVEDDLFEYSLPIPLYPLPGFNEIE
jgi:CubicO group peptidase (beta-lactamase class C family)